ncbi:putative mitochondrial protein, partial [Mucuna pruriens]
MDDFIVYADLFDACLDNLSKVLTRCIDTNLGIVLGHLVSNRGLAVDKSKIDIITSFPNPAFVWEVSTNDSSRISAKLPCHCPSYYKRMWNSTNWDLPFELMWDASDSALGAVLGQRDGVGKPMHELLAIVFALDKLRSYLLGSKIVVFSNHAALRFLLKKPDAKDKKGDENFVADHLSRIGRENEPMSIKDEFPDEQLLHITTPIPWFANICNFVAASQFPQEASWLYKEKLRSDAKYYIWDDPYLWRVCSDQVIRMCIPEAEINSILQLYHAAPGGGHYGATRNAKKVLDCGLYWPTIFIDAYQFVSTYDKCQKARMAITRRHEMPQQPILFCEVFNVWGIDFIRPFLVSNGYSYILLAVDYVSRWVEAIATKTSDAKVVMDSLKSNIFQAEIFNREIKKTQQKMTNPNRKDWS